MAKPDGQLLDTKSLKNGLTAYVYDRSKSLVGKRMQVTILVCIPVEIKPEHFGHERDPVEACRSFKAAVGETLSFRVEKTRNFIADDEVGAMVAKMTAQFWDTNLSYLSSPDFAAKLVAKKYREWAEEQDRRKVRLEAIRKAETGE